MTGTDKINILVVDDLPEKLLVLKTILEDLGQEVITVNSGPEALRQVLEREFAVILLDVNMPGMDGLETAALIRRRKKSAHTPIIFLTAFADEMHTAKGYELGAVDYILAPVVPEVLRTKVKVFVELFRMTQQVKRQADEQVMLAREQAARAAAEAAIERSTFLAEASKVLANSLDFAATLRGLLRVVLPRLADVSAITILDAMGGMGSTEAAWLGPANVLQSRPAVGPAQLYPDLATAVQRVLTAGKMECLPEMGIESSVPLDWPLFDPNGLVDGPCPEFELRSVVLLPLLARDRVLGVLLLGLGAGRRRNPADVALAQDLAGRAAIALDNARLYSEVQEADRRKNEFLSMLAHELRNPLAPIRNAVHLLGFEDLTRPEFEEARDIIGRQVVQLVRLVDDLLDISRITSGKIRLQTEPVDVTDVVERALETSQPILDSRQHELTVTLPPQPVLVQADPVRLAQVLTNLLNNSAKYTEEGGQVWLTVERDGDDVLFRVRDTGIGIPSDMLASIFELFTQAERSLDRSQGGLGVGLTLVRRLVEMHAGTVQAFSAGPYQGSEFVVRLPVLKAAPRPAVVATNGTPRPIAGAVARSILVVDDNMDAADSLALLLRMAGHTVHVAHDGPEALTAANALRPGVVLLDIGLPGMDGYEVARRLCEQFGPDRPMLVALTGYGQDEDIRLSQAAGFDHHLVKPADLDALATLLEGARQPA